MSIAISAEIRPSRTFSFFYLGFAVAFFLTGILTSLGKIGNFETIARQLLALSMFLVACFLIFSYFRARKTLLIDISGNGQIRLKEYRRSVSKPSTEDGMADFHDFATESGKQKKGQSPDMSGLPEERTIQIVIYLDSMD